jgi:hypothetical protein
MPADKAGIGMEGSKLWRDQTQEGIDGRHPLVSATARIRRGNNALKTTASELLARVPPAALIERTTNAANVKKARPPRGGPTAMERKP